MLAIHGKSGFRARKTGSFMEHSDPRYEDVSDEDKVNVQFAIECSKGNLDEVKLMLETENIDFNKEIQRFQIKNPNLIMKHQSESYTGLEYACIYSHLDIVKHISKFYDQKHLIDLISFYGNIEIINVLLEHIDFQDDEINEYMGSNLRKLINKLNILELILKKGFDFNRCSKNVKRVVIHQNFYLEFYQLLVKYDIDLNDKDIDLLFIYCFRIPNVEILQFFIDKNVKLKIQDNFDLFQQYSSFRDYKNIINCLDIISSLENFDDFLRINSPYIFEKNNQEINEYIERFI